MVPTAWQTARPNHSTFMTISGTEKTRIQFIKVTKYTRLLFKKVRDSSDQPFGK